MDFLFRPQGSKLENLKWCEDFCYLLVFMTEVESIIDQGFYLISGTDGAALSLYFQWKTLWFSGESVPEAKGYIRSINRCLFE